MAEYIKKEDLKFLEIPIAPVLQGEQVHYEQGLLKEWLENVPPANVVEREKIDKAIEEIRGYTRFHRDKIHNDVEQGKYLAYEKCIEILKRNIGE